MFMIKADKYQFPMIDWPIFPLPSIHILAIHQVYFSHDMMSQNHAGTEATRNICMSNSDDTASIKSYPPWS